MFVRSGMHEVVVAGHIREAGLDGQIPVVRQRQSFLPPFQQKKEENLIHVCWPAVDNKLLTQSTLSKLSNFHVILTWRYTVYSTFQYTVASLVLKWKVFHLRQDFEIDAC